MPVVTELVFDIKRQHQKTGKPNGYTCYINEAERLVFQQVSQRDFKIVSQHKDVVVLFWLTNLCHLLKKLIINHLTHL
jgi:hypothetical protein